MRARPQPAKLDATHPVHHWVVRAAGSGFGCGGGIRALSAACLFVLASCAATPSAPAKVADFRGRIGVLCPDQVAPRIPEQAERDRISGKVVADARVVKGAVVDVKIRSGPRIYRTAVVEAMKQYRCDREVAQAVTNQQFVFDMSRTPAGRLKAEK